MWWLSDFWLKTNWSSSVRAFRGSKYGIGWFHNFLFLFISCFIKFYLCLPWHKSNFLFFQRNSHSSIFQFNSFNFPPKIFVFLLSSPLAALHPLFEWIPYLMEGLSLKNIVIFFYFDNFLSTDKSKVHSFKIHFVN